MRQKKSWEMSEEELLEREEAYLKNYNAFQQLVDNHWYYLLIMTFTTPMWFLIGLAIGMLMAR